MSALEEDGYDYMWVVLRGIALDNGDKEIRIWLWPWNAEAKLSSKTDEPVIGTIMPASGYGGCDGLNPKAEVIGVLNERSSELLNLCYKLSDMIDMTDTMTDWLEVFGADCVKLGINVS